MIKKIIYLSIIMLLLNCISYFFIGKENMYYDYVKRESVNIKGDSVNIFFISNKSKLYRKRHSEFESFFEKKQHKSLTFFYVDKNGFYLTDNFSQYAFEIKKMIPFLALTNKGEYGESNWCEIESIYIWCFYKWIKLYECKKYVL